MANMIQRFKDIMTSNINALLDRAEDPEKMIAQYMRDLDSDLGNVKSQLVTAMAAETKAKRELDECDAEIARMLTYAQKALQEGSEEDARKFLEKKQTLTETRTHLESAYANAQDTVAKMQDMNKKLVSDMEQLKQRQETIRVKMSVAKTQETLNKISGSADMIAGHQSNFERMEERTEERLDRANAEASLADQSEEDGLNALTEKYDKNGTSQSIEDELNALKSDMGL